MAAAGEMPEIAFYMVGPIEEVTKKAERLAEERRYTLPLPLRPHPLIG